MTTLQALLETHVSRGTVPGAVALLSRDGRTEVAVAGSTCTTTDVDSGGPMARDSLFRIASVTKPVMAAAVMMLVDDGRLALDDAVERWLPELAGPSVVRTPSSPLEDVVPASRPITVSDLLTSRAGYGFPSDFSLPQVQRLFTVQHGPMPQGYPDPDTWLARLAEIPLLHQPGEAWLYNTCSDLQGVLVARVTGACLADVLAERVLDPLGMTDTGFHVPPDRVARLTGCYRAGADGFELVDPPQGEWSRPAAFGSGAGGLVSTVDDWHRFARLLLGRGELDGRRLLSDEAVALMTTNHLTRAQREASGLFTEGQGWGFGGSVDVELSDPWNVLGRYGWVGGTGTTAHLVPATGTVAILLTQVEMAGPTPPQIMRDFWTLAARS